MRIDWDRLIAKRPTVLETIDEMPSYLLKPEVLTLLDMEKHPTYRLILDLMWTTGARISEVLALTPGSFEDDGYDFGGILKTLKQRPGRPKKKSLQRSFKRYYLSWITYFKTEFKVISMPAISEKHNDCFQWQDKRLIDTSIN